MSLPQAMWLVGHRRRLVSQGALRTRRAGLHGLRAAMLLLFGDVPGAWPAGGSSPPPGCSALDHPIAEPDRTPSPLPGIFPR
ncbi:MAG: hypothetical protein QG612_2740 [Pseudomonadota bacterium]|nr:hypothetical protein [Pseudomonadota bacterium]